MTIAETQNLSMYLHYWFEDIATPHHHSWSGFFMNLKGTVLHSIYEFAETEIIGPNMRFRNLTTKTVEVLTPGDCVLVEPGENYIHGLWHTDTPCISLSVRSNRSKSPSNHLTIDYDKSSGVAISMVERREDIEQLLKWMRLQERIDENKYHEIIDNSVNNQDTTTVLLLLNSIIRIHNKLDLAEYLKMQQYTIDPLLLKKYINFSKSITRNRLFTKIRLNAKDFELHALFGALYLVDNLEQFFKIINKVFPSEKPDKKACQLLYMAMLTQIVEELSLHLKQSLRGYFESILLKKEHQIVIENITHSKVLPKEEKQQLTSIVDSIRQSIIFTPLYEF